MNTVLKQVNKSPLKWISLYTNVKYFGRAITGDRVRPLNEDTLTGRFLLYLDNNKIPKDVSNNIDKVGLIATLKSQPADIKTFDARRVISVLNSLNDSAVVQNKHEFHKLLHIIDSECCNRINDFDIDDTFNLLCTFMTVIPHQITKCHYFHLTLEHLVNKKDHLNKDQLIHLLFFIGLLKKSTIAQNMIRNCLMLFDKNLIDNLTKEDLCIICNTTFKTSTKIKSVLLLDKIKLYINDNLYLLNDPAVFVTLIKTLRHNRYQDDDILSTLTCTIFFNKTLQHYSFSALCHILAFYADYLYYDENILCAFTKKCLEQLKESQFKTKDAYLAEQPRTKDIKRFLWALSNLNYKLTKEDIENIIIPQILIRVKAGEFVNDPGSMVQIILYLWMMQYKAFDLIKEFLTEEVAQFIRAKNLQCQDSLNLLLTCIYYEDPEFFYSLKIRPEKRNNYNLNIQLSKRPVLKKIVDNLKSVALENEIDKYEIGCQVPYINIIGVTGFQKRIYKTLNIEVLDDYTCLKNTENMPTGLMQLKLRILEKCDEGLVVIEEPCIADYSGSELQHILEDEITLVC